MILTVWLDLLVWKMVKKKTLGDQSFCSSVISRQRPQQLFPAPAASPVLLNLLGDFSDLVLYNIFPNGSCHLLSIFWEASYAKLKIIRSKPCKIQILLQQMMVHLPQETIPWSPSWLLGRHSERGAS